MHYGLDPTPTNQDTTVNADNDCSIHAYLIIYIFLEYNRYPVGNLPSSLIYKSV